MPTPTSFVLPEPIKNSPRPSPGPPSYLKHQVYDDPHVFEKVDCHAIRVSQNSYPCFRDLLWDLVFRYQLSDLEKARVIFRWMTACDMNVLSFESNKKNSPEEVLLSLKNLKGSYANAFELMCSYAGLCCLTISGFAKGVDYKPGDTFQKDGYNHTWNVIYLQNSWQLIDAHWATRYLTSGKNTQDSIVYQYDDFYFIMEPQQAVYSHFPENTEWQLLEKPLKLNQFENLPLTKSQFFKCGMDFRNQHHGVVYSKDGNLKMNLGFWKPDSFTYKLQKQDNSDKFDDVSLRYYVLQETVNNQINFFFRFPTAGVFYLTIFAQELNEHNQPINQENTFRAACEYKIVADKAAANHSPYPMTCHDSNWGPSWSLISHYQLTPQQEDGVISITSPNGKPFVRTEIVFDKHQEDVSLLCKLRKNGVEEEDILDQYIEIVEKSDKTSFIINLPEPGEYGLEVYANEPLEGDTYTHICQYLLDFEAPAGYKPQESIFGKVKGDNRTLSHKPSKIRDMYNYEKDAAPIGSLPKPYMPTQYAPEDITMIPGQAKIKPMPFAYQQNETKHKKTDDSDLEMPDFLPPPPPLSLSNQNNSNIQYDLKVNTVPPPPPNDLLNQMNSANQYTGQCGRNINQSDYQHDDLYNTAQEIGGKGSFQLPPPNDLPNKPYMENQINQFGPSGQHSVKGGRNANQPDNQTMYSGNKFNAPQNIGGKTSAKFPPPNDLSNNSYSDNQINQSGIPGQHTLQGVKNSSQPTNQQMHPGDKFNTGQKNLNFSIQAATPFSKSTANTGNVYNPLNASEISQRSGSNERLNTYKTEYIDNDSAKLQPYLANVEKGQSPQLSRKVFNSSKDPSQSANQTMGGKLAPPSGSQDNKVSVHAQYSGLDNDERKNLSELNIVSLAFGKNDDITVQQPYLQNLLTGGSPGLSRKNIQKPYEPNQGKGSNISSGSSPSLDRLYNKEQETLNTDEKKQPAFRGYGRPNFKTDISSDPSQGLIHQEHVPGSNLSDKDHSKLNQPPSQQYRSDGSLIVGAGSNIHPSQQYRSDGSLIVGAGSNIHPSQQYRSDGSLNVGAGSNIHASQISDQSGLANQNQGMAGNQYPPLKGYGNETNQYLSSANTSSDPKSLTKQSNYKGQEANYGNPGYTTGTYNVNVTKDNYENQNDPKKISNIAATLSPSGYKNLNKSDPLYDQYNKQYEDSSKVLPSPLQKYRPDESTANWTSGPMQKEPPKNFEPTPIAVEEEIYKPEIQAFPSEQFANVAISPEETSKIFQKVDEHAMQVSSQQQDNFNQLIWQLIYARNITDELEKVRVIFLWLCTKDLHKMNFDNTKQDSPEEILMGIRTGKSTYAQIFLTLCRYAGLHCKLIVGYAKGADYVPGMKFQGRQGEHSWNAVLIEGVWRLIDCHWAARRLIGKEHTPENVRYELDMFYFLANPSQLIYTHYPHDSDWQLLHHSINIDEFESLAPVKSMFFKYNLDLITHKNAVIHSNEPEFELRIAFPKGIEERLLFTFTLSFHDGKEEHNGVPLLRYGRQEYDFDNNHSCFWIRTPIPGAYKLLIYAKMINSEPNISESESQKMFGAICEYKIDSNFSIKQAMPHFPPCQSSTYGPNEMYKKYPIESKNLKSSFFIDNGTVEIKFLIKRPDIRIMAKLFSSKLKDSDQLTEQCVLQRLIGNEEAIISVFLPEPGEYGLEVYANEQKKNGNSFYAVWQYFIVSTSESIISGLPSLQPGYLGPYEPKFTEYGMSAYSHKDPFVVAITGDLCIQLKTTREKPVRIMAQLIHCSHNVAEMCSDQVLQLGRDSVVYFLLRLPHQGFFKLQIFALPYSEMSESLPGVFNYLIECNQKSQNRVPFPQQFAQWKEGCYLYEPTNGELGVVDGQPDKITFRMDVMRAKTLAVIVDNEWTKLEKNSDDTWTGVIDMKEVWKKKGDTELTVCANYGVVDDSYTTILRYTVRR